MTNPAPPRPLTFWTAVTCALLLMLVLQIVLSRRGLHLAEAWRDYAAASPPRLQAAMAWWIIAGAAFAAGAGVAALLCAYPPPWRRHRALRWIAGAALVLALAHLGHSAAPPAGVTAGVDLLSTLTAAGLAALVAMLGAYFGLRR